MPTSFLCALIFAITTLPALACSTSDDSGDPGSTSETADPDSSGAPTPAATAADEAFRVAPDGYVDCGATNLTSGWPTTAVYLETDAQCIVDAARTGAPSQYVYYGRDGAGGIDGTIVRVDSADEITMVEYHVAADGVIDSSETSCSSLSVASFTPPVCDS